MYNLYPAGYFTTSYMKCASQVSHSIRETLEKTRQTYIADYFNFISPYFPKKLDAQSRKKVCDSVLKLAENDREQIALQCEPNEKSAGYLNGYLPKGNGEPVLLMPGFSTGADSLESLSKFLTESGYSVYDWRQGHNWGPCEVSMEDEADHVREISKNHGGKPVHIVGQSLGGREAIHLTHLLDGEGLVSSVTTLGSPVNFKDEQDANPQSRLFFDWLNAPDSPEMVEWNKRDNEIANIDNLGDVFITHIYSHSDRVIPPKQAVSHFTGNVVHAEVTNAPHRAMGYDPMIRAVLLTRLDQANKDEHRPVSERDFPALLNEDKTTQMSYQKPYHSLMNPYGPLPHTVEL